MYVATSGLMHYIAGAILIRRQPSSNLAGTCPAVPDPNPKARCPNAAMVLVSHYRRFMGMRCYFDTTAGVDNIYIAVLLASSGGGHKHMYIYIYMGLYLARYVAQWLK